MYNIYREGNFIIEIDPDSWCATLTIVDTEKEKQITLGLHETEMLTDALRATFPDYPNRNPLLFRKFDDDDIPFGI